MAQVSARPDTFPLQVDELGRGTHIPPMTIDPQVRQHLESVMKPVLEHLPGSFSLLLQELSLPPAATTVRLNTLKYSKEDAIKRLTEMMKECYEKRVDSAPAILSHPVLSDVVLIPTRGPVGGVRPSPREVVVGLQCGEAVLRGADVFAPGLCGSPKDLKIGEKVSVLADVNGSCNKGLCSKFEGEAVFVGNGVVRMERAQIFGRDRVMARGVAVEMTEPLYDSPPLSVEELGDLGFLQNLPSILTSHVLDPQPGETVLDMCASPGGKTTHIAMLMKNKGCVIALDKSPSKISKVEKNVERFALTNVHCYAFNATKCLSDNKEVNKGPLPHPPPYPPESFDRVLLDAPCSALGQRPQIKCPLSLVDLKSFQSYQRHFLTQAVGLLRPGGTLVYSTCTFTPEENEVQVAWLLQSHPCMELVEQSPYLGCPGWEGYGLLQPTLVQRFGPSRFYTHLLQGAQDSSHTEDSIRSCRKYACCDDAIGFFLVAFTKRCSGR